MGNLVVGKFNRGNQTLDKLILMILHLNFTQGITALFNIIILTRIWFPVLYSYVIFHDGLLYEYTIYVVLLQM